VLDARCWETPSAKDTSDDVVAPDDIVEDEEEVKDED
jgi:hypothetical protein